MNVSSAMPEAQSKSESVLVRNRLPVAFSFDVEEHYRIEAAYGVICPAQTQQEYAKRMEQCTRWLVEAVEQSGGKATFFFVGQIAQTHPQLIREIVQAGHEIACHSWAHERIHRLTSESFRNDLRSAKQALEEVSGQKVVGYRAPTFSITRETSWAIDALVAEGFSYDSSIFPVRHDRYGIPDAPTQPFWAIGANSKILELPPATLRVGRTNLPAAGGGYFRLFPSGILRRAARKRAQDPLGAAVLYFHPWEFDPEQPKLPLKKLSKWRTYVGISSTRKRLQKLLREFESVRMIDLAERALTQTLCSFPIGSAC